MKIFKSWVSDYSMGKLFWANCRKARNKQFTLFPLKVLLFCDHNKINITMSMMSIRTT